MNGSDGLSADGLKVLVTAAASGIGYAVAEAFSAAGAQIHICDISDEAFSAASENHADWRMTHCDVGDEGQVRRLFDEIETGLGGLDVLINNAGIGGPTGGVEEISPEEWRRTVDVNLNGHFYCTRLAVPLLRKSDRASIIFISSVAGRLGFAYRTPYAASKWALIGLMKSLASELGPDGIRVNAILPGVVEGPRIKRVIAARAKVIGVSYEEMERQNLEKVSLRKMVTAQDIAHQVLFLCSPLGANISGQPISVCGNVEAL
jgi:NAD(P)-dependent dehydrogenase (short-subunit alcohol dehydrogenase family)